MRLTDEQKAAGRARFLDTIGRRDLLKAGLGLPALVAFGAAVAARGPLRGGPVKAALIGVGGQGRTLLGQCRPEFISIQALGDINPNHNRRAADALVEAGLLRPRLYGDWRELLAQEDVEAALIATPLWQHAEIAVGCLEAGRHVLCEKMMAYDTAGCQAMSAAARKNRCVLEIGHQRFYNPIYQAAYENVIRTGVLGEIFHVRLAWHRNGDWRRPEEQAPAADSGFDPGRWGYPDWEHLHNWRFFRKYSGGLMAELASHQLAITDWFLGATPEAVYGSGGIHRYHDGREVADHVYVTLEYPRSRTVTFTSIQSNAFDDYYEAFFGTEGTLILTGETDAFLFSEKDESATVLDVSPKTGNVVVEASASRAADASGSRVVAATAVASGGRLEALSPYGLEIRGFCGAVRSGAPLRCGVERAARSAAACLVANEAIDRRTRLTIAGA